MGECDRKGAFCSWWGRVVCSFSMMASLPAWKLALLERKKKQEEEEKVKQAQAEEAKLASLPPWKRAILLRERQAKDVSTSTSAAAKSSSNTPASSNKWQVAVERVKGPDSPIIKQKFSSTSTPANSNKWPAAVERADSPIIKQKSQGNVASSNNDSSTAAKPVTRSQVGQKWQHAKATSNAVPAISKPSASESGSVAAEKPKNQVGQRWEHANMSSISKPSEKFGTGLKSNGVEKSSPKVAPLTQHEEKDDPSLSVLPAWKKALILKKRRQKQGSDEPDSGTAAVVADTPVPVTVAATSPPVPPPTKVVNATAEGSTTSQRLIEQEGKTLHAPIYKEVDEWANVKEDDVKFKSLPLWKQALIKRRRADIAKRSGLPVTITPTAPLTLEASPLSKKKNKSANAENLKKPSKSTVEPKKNVKSARLDSSNKASHRKQNSTSRKIPISAKDEKKPARKAPQPPSAKKDKMFTYNFSKSTRHTLDTGGTSSDSTDSELEEAIITNLDESSDEGDSGIVLQRYAAKPNSSPSLGQKSHSESSVSNTTPGPSNPDKKKGKKVSENSINYSNIIHCIFLL